MHNKQLLMLAMAATVALMNNLAGWPPPIEPYKFEVEASKDKGGEIVINFRNNSR